MEGSIVAFSVVSSFFSSFFMSFAFQPNTAVAIDAAAASGEVSGAAAVEAGDVTGG